MHEVEELLDAVLAVPSLTSLDLLRTVLEVFGGGLALCVLAFLANSRGGLPESASVLYITSLKDSKGGRERDRERESGGLTSSGSSSSSSSSSAPPPLDSSSSPPSSLSSFSSAPSSLSSASSLAGASACALRVSRPSSHTQSTSKERGVAGETESSLSSYATSGDSRRKEERGHGGEEARCGDVLLHLEREGGGARCHRVQRCGIDRWSSWQSSARGWTDPTQREESVKPLLLLTWHLFSPTDSFLGWCTRRVVHKP